MAVESKTFIGKPEVPLRFGPALTFNRASLYESILPIYNISKVLGLTCVAKESVNGNLRFKESKIGVVFNALWLIAIISVGLLSSFHLHKVNVTFMSPFSVLLSLCNLWSPIVLCLCCLLGARSQKQLISCVTSLNSIDEALAALNIHVPHKQNRRFIFKLVVSSISILFTLMLFDSLLMILDNALSQIYMKHIVSCLVIWFGFYVPKLQNLIIEIQILIWILGIKQRFKLLNRKLGTFTGNKDIVVVKNISEIHADLCQVSRQANATHSLQLLLLILTHFLNVLLTVYSGVLVQLFGVGNQTGSRSLAVFIVYWLAWYVATIMILCKYCGETRIDQNLRTGVLVHQALGRTTDPQIQKQLMMFSNQLIHNKVSITASQFFDVDLKLVAPMAGAVATYLIILVQFEVARSDSSACCDAVLNGTRS